MPRLLIRNYFVKRQSIEECNFKGKVGITPTFSSFISLLSASRKITVSAVSEMFAARAQLSHNR